MAEHRPGSGSSGDVPWLAYLVGALIVVVAALVWKAWSDASAPHVRNLAALNLRLPAPPLPPKLPTAPPRPLP